MLWLCSFFVSDIVFLTINTISEILLISKDLFTEDEEGYTGPFLDLLRKQENEEIKQYVADVSNQIQGADNEVS